MKIYKVYLAAVGDMNNKILIGKTRTRKGVGRIIYRFKKMHGYQNCIIRAWTHGEYTVTDFGSWSWYLLTKEEVI